MFNIKISSAKIKRIGLRNVDKLSIKVQVKYQVQEAFRIKQTFKGSSTKIETIDLKALRYFLESTKTYPCRQDHSMTSPDTKGGLPTAGLVLVADR